MARSAARSVAVSAESDGSLAAKRSEPARSSSQFGPDLGVISFPVRAEIGRAPGAVSPGGASKRSPYR